MILPARKVIESVFTKAAINAEIDLLNTAFTETADHIDAVYDGLFTNAEQLTAWPAVMYHVGAIDPVVTEVPRTGKRDAPGFPVALSVHDRVGSLASSRRNLEVTLEALLPLIDSLRSQTYKTNWGILNVDAPAIEIMPYVQDGSVIRLDGIARFTMLVRRTGL